MAKRKVKKSRKFGTQGRQAGHDQDAPVQDAPINRMSPQWQAFIQSIGREIDRFDQLYQPKG
jgi:hypothetical protein